VRRRRLSTVAPVAARLDDPAPATVFRRPSSPIDVEAALPFDWAREAARHVGTVAHRVIAQIASEGRPRGAVRAWPLVPASSRRARGGGR
jgi:hypothetical protein